MLAVAAGIALGAWAFSRLGGWIFSRVVAKDAVAASTGRPWPGGMGRLDAVIDRFPPQHANQASATLAALTKALPKNEAIDDFVRREITRGQLTIGEPPSLPDVTAIRELLLREPIAWESHQGIGDADTESMRTVELTAARALIASALAKAHAGQPAAWEDLHAAWRLARALDGQPQMMAQTAGLTTVRMINAVAWRLPIPAPAWFDELQQRDNVQPLLESFQYQTASYWKDGARMFPTRWFANSIEHDRRIAEELFNRTQCDANARANEVGTDLTSVWRRAFRYRAEREATANALRARAGLPIEEGSHCSDGRWTFDGKTLRFAKPIALPERRDTSMPLTLRVRE